MPTIAIYGSATVHDPKLIGLAEEVGRHLKKLDCRIISGASTGIAEIVLRSLDAPERVRVFSPAKDLDDQQKFKTVTSQFSEDVFFAGGIFEQLLASDAVSGTPDNQFKFRNFLTASVCDVAVCIHGGPGTFTEVCNVLALSKPVISFVASGGASACAPKIAEMIGPSSGTVLEAFHPKDIGHLIRAI